LDDYGFETDCIDTYSGWQQEMQDYNEEQLCEDKSADKSEDCDYTDYAECFFDLSLDCNNEVTACYYSDVKNL